MGIIPVYWDVNPDTCLAKLEQGFEKGIKAVIYHHHLGIPGNLEFWTENDIPIIEDITEIIGGEFKKEEKNPQGHLAIVDLSEKGHFTAGGGGLLLSFSKKEHSLVKGIVENFSPSSFLSDLNGVFGASQWSRMDRFTKKREEVLEIYKAALLKSRHRGFAMDDDVPFVPTSFPVLLSTGGKETFSYTKKKKVSCEQAFTDSIFTHYELNHENLPGVKQLSLRCVLFPLYPSLTNVEVDLISKVLASLP